MTEGNDNTSVIEHRDAEDMQLAREKDWVEIGERKQALLERKRKHELEVQKEQDERDRKEALEAEKNRLTRLWRHNKVARFSILAAFSCFMAALSITATAEWWTTPFDALLTAFGFAFFVGTIVLTWGATISRLDAIDTSKQGDR